MSGSVESRVDEGFGAGIGIEFIGPALVYQTAGHVEGHDKIGLLKLLRLREKIFIDEKNKDCDRECRCQENDDAVWQGSGCPVWHSEGYVKRRRKLLVNFRRRRG